MALRRSGRVQNAFRQDDGLGVDFGGRVGEISFSFVIDSSLVWGRGANDVVYGD